MRGTRPILSVVFALLLVTSPIAATVTLGQSTATAEPTTTTDGTPTESTTTASPNETDSSPYPLPDRSDLDPVNGTVPKDNDGDGRYEDLNANGELDIGDAVLHFRHQNDPSMADHVVAYDYNNNGRLDIADSIRNFHGDIVPVPASPSNDTDGDGLSDRREVELGTNPNRTDSDGDGISDWVETDYGEPVDTDGDGTVDALDLDSDGDGLPDAREGTKDTDGDGVPNYRDADDDGDGIDTRVEVLDGRNVSHDVDRDGTPNWLDRDSDGDGIPDGEEGLADPDGDGIPAYLDNDADNDGLPDAYERNVTGTDPRNNDSASNLTTADEADNGVVDGMEDFDGDGLPNAVEYRLGTDPLAADTDGDGLNDSYERGRSWANATVADTDGDGVSDGASDRDGDGLTNEREAELGTRATSADTDRDGLDDAAELANGTDPLVADTDGDGLDDGTELDLGTDPTVSDTDGDGTLDANETFETSKSDEETGATVAVTGEGDAASGVAVDPAPSLDAAAGSAVHLSNATAFERATVTVPVDDSLTRAQLANLTLYKWNGTADEPWRALNTTVDVANHTATATVRSFSTVRPELETRHDRDVVVEDVDPVEFGDAAGFDCTGACQRNGSSLSLAPSDATVAPPDTLGADVGAVGAPGPGDVDLTPPVPDDVDLVVAKNGSGDDHTIQAAVNAADDGDTILVREGVYREQVVVNESLTLVGQNATLMSPEDELSDDAGIEIRNATTLRGFTFRGYEYGVLDNTSADRISISDSVFKNTRTGISSPRTTTDWSLSSVTFNSTEYPIDAHNATGDWSLSSVSIDSEHRAINAQNTAGDWSLSSVSIDSSWAGAGIYADNASEDWSLSSVSINSEYRGINGNDVSGDWSLSGVLINSEDSAVDVPGASGNWSMSSVSINSNSWGVAAHATSGDWSLSRVSINSEDSGIDVPDASGDWSLSSVSINNSGYRGVIAYDSGGNWSLSSVSIHSGSKGIVANRAQGYWSLSSVSINSRSTGVEAYDARGDWSLSSVFINSWQTGLVAHEATGDWSLSSVAINTSKTNLRANQSTGEWWIRNSSFLGSGAKVTAGGRASDLNARHNWWGQPGGPSNQSVGPQVDASNPCQSPCGPSGVARSAPPLTDLPSGPGSKARWRQSVPDAEVTQLAVRYRTASASDDAWATLTAETSTHTRSWRLPLKGAAEGRTTTLRARGLSGDATLTVRSIGADLTVESVRVRADSDGDGLPDRVEGVELRPEVGPVTSFSTDPEDPDTDNDGLEDGEEIEVVPASESSVDAPAGSLVVETVHSDPTSVDTDGDGLTDRRETEGWTIRVAPDAETTREYLNTAAAGQRPDVWAIMYRYMYVHTPAYCDQAGLNETARAFCDPNDGSVADYGGSLGIENRSAFLSRLANNSRLNESILRGDASEFETKYRPEYLRNRTVDSDPMLVDSDADGLSDEQEATRGTDPGRADTDGDGIRDGVETVLGQPPTLFDHRAPTVSTPEIEATVGQEVEGDAASPNQVRVHYRTRYRARDPSGVRRLGFGRTCEVDFDTNESQVAEPEKISSWVDCQVALRESVDGAPTVTDGRVEYAVNESEENVTNDVVASSFVSPQVTVVTVDANGNRAVRRSFTHGTSADQIERATANPYVALAMDTSTSMTPVDGVARVNGVAIGARDGLVGYQELLEHPKTLYTWLYYVEDLPKAVDNAPEALDGLQRPYNPYERDEVLYDDYKEQWLAGYVLGTIGLEAIGSRGAGAVKKAAKVETIVDAAKGAPPGVLTGASGRTVRRAARVAEDADVDPAATRRVLADVPVRRRAAVADQLRKQNWDAIRTALPDDAGAPSELVGRAIARTGDGGSELVSHLTATGNDAALRAFLTAEDAPVVQRTTVRAFRTDPDVGTSEVATALRRYESLGPADQASYRRLIERRGTSAIRVTSTFDAATFDEFYGLRTARPDGGFDGATADDLREHVVDYWSRYESRTGRLPESDVTRDTSRIVTNLRGLDDANQDAVLEFVDETGPTGVSVLRESTPTDMRRIAAFVEEAENADFDWASRIKSLDTAGTEKNIPRMIFKPISNKQLRKVIPDDTNLATWRLKVVRSVGKTSGRAAPEDIESYLQSINEVDMSLVNYDNRNSVVIDLLGRNSDTPGEFVGKIGEVERISYHTNNGVEVEVEPNPAGSPDYDRIDLALKRSSGTSYVEIKSASRPVDSDWIRSNLFRESGSVENSFRNSPLPLPRNGKVGTIVARRGLTKSVESDIQATLTRIVNDQSSVSFDTVRIVDKSSGKVTTCSISKTGVSC